MYPRLAQTDYVADNNLKLLIFLPLPLSAETVGMNHHPQHKYTYFVIV